MRVAAGPFSILVGTGHCDYGHCGRLPHTHSKRKVSFTIPVAATIILMALLIMASLATGPGIMVPADEIANTLHVSAAAAATTATLNLEPTTDAPMVLQPPFYPTCFVKYDDMRVAGCPYSACIRADNCTVSNPKCCIYVMHSMLSFLGHYLEAKCLQSEYVLVYGTLLAAIRNKTLFPYDSDVDIAATPLLLQFLELNATKEELWRYGYAVWYYKDHPALWRLCPHLHHPDPAMKQSFMSAKDEAIVDSVYPRNGPRYFSSHVDIWPMWRVADSTTDCKSPAGLDFARQLAVPWDAPSQPPIDNNLVALRYGSNISPCQMASLAKPGDVKYCALHAPMPYLVSRVPAQAQVSNQSYSVPTNAEQ